MDENESVQARQTLLKSVLELEAKALNYLLIANGAGLAAGLAALKDYGTVPLLHGIGTMIALFSGGLVSAMVAFFLFELGSFEAMREVTIGGDGSRFGRLLMSGMNLFMTLSGVLFAIAILLIGKKFAAL